MDTYKGFADVYDRMMDNIPYEEWGDYIISLLQQKGIMPGAHILELGCGTGSICLRLSRAGYHMTGLDLSGEMLAVAEKKTKGEPIVYSKQDMTSFYFEEMFDAAISVCDSMNYLLEEEQFYNTLYRVKEHLKEGGCFLFDVKTPYFYEKVCGDQVFAEDQEDYSYIWDNCYDEKQKIHEYAVTIFEKLPENGYYQKFTEFHYQRAYEQKELKQMLLATGFQNVKLYRAFTDKKAGKRDERWYAVAEQEITENKAKEGKQS